MGKGNPLLLPNMRGLAFYLLLVTFYLTSACTPYGIKQEEVVQTLTEYGKQNPEQYVLIDCPYGRIKAKFSDKAPLHRANLIRLVKLGYYSEQAQFYRVIAGFVVQGGDQTRREPSYLVPNEINPALAHTKGALAAARRDDNPGQASNPTDFYFVHGHGCGDDDLARFKIHPGTAAYAQYRKAGGAPELDGKYTVFGHIVEGQDVVNKIAQQQVLNEKPLQPIKFRIWVE